MALKGVAEKTAAGWGKTGFSGIGLDGYIYDTPKVFRQLVYFDAYRYSYMQARKYMVIDGAI